MEKDIYLIRHGETEYNKSGRVQGSGINAALNTMGKNQAKAFFHKYKHISFDKIYVSTLQRAIETVQPFILHGVPFEQHIGLNEINWGIFEGTTFTTSSNNYYRDMLRCWSEGQLDRRISGGESPLDVAIRQQPVIDLILSRKHERRILICMHGRAMRIFLCQLLGKPIQEMEEFMHVNLSLYQLSHNGENIKLLKENCTDHLIHLQAS